MLKVPPKRIWSKISPASFTFSAAGSTVLEDMLKNSEPSSSQKKKRAKTKTRECLKCKGPVSDTNRYLCDEHFEQGKDSEMCQGPECHYKSSHFGFCGHHITKDPEKQKINYDTCRKIRVKPNKQQTQILKQWFGVAKKCYNQAVFLRRKKLCDFEHLRDTVTATLDAQFDYVKRVPLKVKQEAVADYLKASSNAYEKFKKTRKHQKIRYKKRAMASESININHEAIKIINSRHVRIYPTKMPGALKLQEKIQEIPTHCRLVMKHRRYFYLCIPLVMERITPNVFDDCVALDPGERTFQTFYSPKIYGHLAYHPREERLMGPFIEGDKLRSKITRLKAKLKNGSKRSRKKARKMSNKKDADRPLITGKKRKRLKNRIKWLQRMYLSNVTKPKRLAEEMHRKAATFLCKNFKTVFIPKYSSKELAPNLYKTVNRSNYALGHYSFRERLLHVAKRFGTNVKLVSEDYTSKTCTVCGHVDNISNDEMLQCTRCRVWMNRDIRGSRNIFIRSILNL